MAEIMLLTTLTISLRTLLIIMSIPIISSADLSNYFRMDHLSVFYN